MKRFPEDDPEGLFPRRGRRGRGKTGFRRQLLSSSIRHSGVLQRVLPRYVKADLRLEEHRELAQSLASDGAPRVVLDTNVVSAGIAQSVDNKTRAASRILQMVFSGWIMPVALPYLSRELESLGEKRRRGNPGSWTDAHEKLLTTYKPHVYQLVLADILTVDDSRLGEALGRITNLVPDDPSDVRGPLASALISVNGPLSVVTYDRHILDNAEAIRDELGIEAVKPETWLQSVAAGLLAGGED